MQIIRQSLLSSHMAHSTEQRDVAEVLNRLGDFAALGRTPLAMNHLVDLEVTRAGFGDTPFQRGRALSRLIRDEVNRQFILREQQREVREAAEWSILYLRVCEGRSLPEIAVRLSIPMRTVARYYARAKELLLDRLYAMDEAARSGIHCPGCGAHLGNRQSSEPIVCERCRAELVVSALQSDSLHIIMKTPPSLSASRYLAEGHGNT